MKRYDPKLVEALLRWVETGMVNEVDGAGYELAQAVRESAVEERTVEGIGGSYPSGFVLHYEGPDPTTPEPKCWSCTIILHDAPAPGEEGA